MADNTENKSENCRNSDKHKVSGSFSHLKFGPRWVDVRWLVIGALCILTLLLGYAGFLKYFGGKRRTTLDLFYYMLQLFTIEQGETVGNVPWELQVARVMAPILAAYTAISGLYAIFREQIMLISSQWYKDHVIVCGLGLKGTLIADDMYPNHKVIAIEKDENNPEIPKLKCRGVVVLIGNAVDPDVLCRAGVHRAKYLISVCGDDGINAEVAVNARELIRSYGDRRVGVLTCFIHIYEPELCEFLMEREMATPKDSKFRLEIFNIFMMGARKLLSRYPVTNSEKKPHILVIGLGNVGESLVVEAVKQWKNKLKDNESLKNKKLKIAAIDKFAYQKLELIETRHPFLQKYCDVKGKQINIYSPEFYNIDFSEKNAEHNDVSGIYICLGDDSLGLKTALKLFYKMKEKKVPIVVVMTSNSGLANLLKKDEDEQVQEKFEFIRAFGLWNMTCNRDLLNEGLTERLARMYHAEYLKENQDKDPEVYKAVVPWEKLAEYHREENRRRVDGLYRRLKKVGLAIKISNESEPEIIEYTDEETEKLARLEHERYCESKIKGGWKESVKRDYDNKKSPIIKDWYNITPEEREKNRISVKKEPRMLSELGFKIYKLKG